MFLALNETSIDNITMPDMPTAQAEIKPTPIAFPSNSGEPSEQIKGLILEDRRGRPCPARAGGLALKRPSLWTSSKEVVADGYRKGVMADEV